MLLEVLLLHIIHLHNNTCRITSSFEQTLFVKISVFVSLVHYKNIVYDYDRLNTSEGLHKNPALMIKKRK